MKHIFKSVVIVFLTMIVLGGCNKGETAANEEKATVQSNESIEQVSEEDIIEQAIVDFYTYYPDNKHILNVDEVKEYLDSFFILDVRPQDSFHKGHLPGAVNIPLKEIGKRFNEIPEDKRVLVICTTGQSAAQTSGVLNVGGKEASSLSGGFVAWEEAGLNVEQ